MLWAADGDEGITVTDTGPFAAIELLFDPADKTYWYVDRTEGTDERLSQWSPTEAASAVEVYATLVSDDTGSISGDFDAWYSIDGDNPFWAISAPGIAAGEWTAIVDVDFRRISDSASLGSERLTMIVDRPIAGNRLLVSSITNRRVYTKDILPRWELSGSLGSTYYQTLLANVPAVWGVEIGNGGSTMFVTNYSVSAPKIHQFTLSTPWDVTTASYDSLIEDMSFYSSTARGIAAHPDGDRLYVVGGSNVIWEISLTTAWTLGSTVGTSAFSVDGEFSGYVAYGIAFGKNGERMYVSGTGASGMIVRQYDLSTAWDHNSATFSKDLVVGETGRDVEVSTDGTRLYASRINSGNGEILQYNLSTAWELDSASYASKMVATSGVAPTGLVFEP